MFKFLAELVIRIGLGKETKTADVHWRREHAEYLLDRGDVEGLRLFVLEGIDGLSGRQLDWLFRSLLERGKVASAQELVGKYSASFGPEYREQLEQKLREKGDAK